MGEDDRKDTPEPEGHSAGLMRHTIRYDDGWWGCACSALQALAASSKEDADTLHLLPLTKPRQMQGTGSYRFPCPL
jgi:hypothetical protein